MKKFLALSLLATVTLAYADDSKMSPDLRASKAQHARVIVQYNQQPSGGLLGGLGGLLGLVGSIISQIPLLNAIVADLPLSNILSLSDQPNVKYISLDRTLTPTLSNAAP